MLQSVISAFYAYQNFILTQGFLVTTTILKYQFMINIEQITVPNGKRWRRERESLIYYKNFIPLNLIDIHYTRLHQLQKENRGKIM